MALLLVICRFNGYIISQMQRHNAILTEVVLNQHAMLIRASLLLMFDASRGHIAKIGLRFTTLLLGCLPLNYLLFVILCPRNHDRSQIGYTDALSTKLRIKLVALVTSLFSICTVIYRLFIA